MIDTVGVSCPVDGLDIEELEGRGWSTRTTRTRRGDEVFETVKAFVSRDDGVVFEWFADAHWLTVRASLPRVLGFANDRVLTWPETRRALAVLTGEVGSQMTGRALPELSTWGLWRCDPVHAWPIEPGPYLDALRLARLEHSQAICEPGSVRWRSLRSGAIFGRAYDKAREAGHRVELPLRLELQLRPKSRIVRVRGEQMGGAVSGLTEDVCKSVLRETLSRLGLDRPIVSVSGARSVLVAYWGPRKGGGLWRELLAFEACGGWPSDYTTGKVRRLERDLRAAGIGALSSSGELPALRIE